MDKILSAYDFTIGQYQDIASLMAHMAKAGKSGDDLKEWLKLKRRDMPGKKCPECGMVMVLQALEGWWEWEPVDGMSGASYGVYKADCHWMCRSCRFGEYHPHSAHDELQKYGLKE